ncbi:MULTISPECIES: hypothetical protein [Moorena]|uniref:Cyanobacterial TRADD-N associated 2 transmembrane domain-containing protein n=1 Tax=Moorena bouillonii PNG TaxID=568701 RepID=A0A1U7MV91_9CYAN|nr:MULTISPECIES: hypothetical protein [Moorena]NEO16657.1 hypothetical protein [Moorena sp. SIO3E8]NEQ03201.1 hypothetical protein [Moorena sp. SIO3F7]OLT55937.1 hypothetical protein BJP37_32405 [Moorena bouillonii PNG]
MPFNFNKKPQNNDDYRDIKEEIIRELLRQVRHSYNLALGVTAASALMTLFGVGLLYIDKVSEASLTASGGVLGTINSVQFAKDSQEELEEMMHKLLDETGD